MSGPCFWTNFNLTYEICGGEAGGATFWPVNSTSFDQWLNPTGEPLFFGFNPWNSVAALGQVIEGDFYNYASYGGWPTEPVVDSAAYYQNEFGDYPKAFVIIQTSGLASEAVISATKVSGVDRAFAVEDTFQNYALLSFSYNDPSDFVIRESVYEVTVGGGVLTLTIQSAYIAF